MKPSHIEKLNKFLSYQPPEELKALAKTVGINLDGLADDNQLIANTLVSKCIAQNKIKKLATEVEGKWQYNWANDHFEIRGTSIV